MENYKTSKVGMETARKYADIIDMERPQNEESLRKHPRMTLQNRAKIFSPFAALRGYDDQLAEEKQRSERVTKKILTEEEMREFDGDIEEPDDVLAEEKELAKGFEPTAVCKLEEILGDVFIVGV